MIDVAPTVIAALVSGAVTGAITLAGTVLALRVHFLYLRRDVDWAHTRIDSLEERERARMKIQQESC